MVNHNPIPDVLHDEFVRLLSPLLIPPPPSSGTEPDMTLAPFEWLHFEVSLPLHPLVTSLLLLLNINLSAW